ncbi:Dihydropteroate synthase-like protein [Lipomyces oligophaga]|uniref:Dihydropteroate synthase-like protein n=1 Tax=Lipomyces oligophaga TaxID=45792 RepID=UPI0034CDBBA0
MGSPFTLPSATVTDDPNAPLLPLDTICVNDLRLATSKGGFDVWHRSGRQQPVSIDVWARAPISVAGISDLVEESVHYGILSKAVKKVVESELLPDSSEEKTTHDDSGKALVHEILTAVLGIGANHVRARATLLQKLLRGNGAGWDITVQRYIPYGSEPIVKVLDETAFVTGLQIFAIIGVNPWERLEKQEISIDLEMRDAIGSKSIPIVDISNQIVEIVENSTYQTIEALVSELSRYLCVDRKLEEVKIRARKPRAVAFASGPSVEITRQKRYYSTETSARTQQNEHIAYLGLGSNLGDSAALLEAALGELEARGIKVLRTSSMFETAPMYVENQPRFLNAACKVSTSLSPHELLAAVQDVEKNALGRVKLIDKGPRSIDIDIELYDDVVVRDGAILSIPHLLMLEREFVLRPLVEIAPDYVHPVSTHTIAEHLARLCPRKKFISEMTTVVPLKIPRGTTRQLVFDTIHHARSQTYIMGILNITPDSFSDGGKHVSSDSMLKSARGFVDAYPSVILDIGGQSTNPKSVDPGAEEEIARIVPAIKLLRAQPEFQNTVISIDTYYASVAQAAIEAGADIINDVSAGTLDPYMLSTAAKLDVPIILMHMRGTPQLMTSLTDYKSGDVVAGVAAELSERVRAAEQAGIRRWNIILDPGIGFAKNADQNIQLLRELPYLIQDSSPDFTGLPWLVGASRKAFIGKITGSKSPAERVFGTTAAVASSIIGGAEIVRVHDVEQIADAVKVLDSIYRNPMAIAARN